MPPRYLLAIDQGTSSSRAIVVGGDGRPVATAQVPLASSYPHSGWVEQDADEIWETTIAVVREAISSAGIAPADLSAIGITNQRETTILWDRATGRPVAPAIVWQSRQTAPLVEAIIERGMVDRYQAITGLVPDAYFSATKIAWLLDRVDGLRVRAERGEICFGTVESWLVWNLTGGSRHLSDVTNASRTMLLDLRSLEWSDELLRDLDIPRQLLPNIVPSVGELAVTDAGVIGAEIPIAGLAGDQQSALVGQACFHPGQAKATYGTGSFVLLNTGREPVISARRMLSTVGYRIENETTYALEGAIFVTGAAVQWLRDELGIISSAAEVEELAASVPDSDDVVFVPALTGLGAPDWDASARGALLGITRGTTKAHIARATLEGIAFQVADVLGAMQADAGIELTEVRVDGGAARNNLLMQIQADLLGVSVVRAATTETTALGAAWLAGLGRGIWSTTAELEALWQSDQRFEPQTDAQERAARHARWRTAVERAKGWAG